MQGVKQEESLSAEEENGEERPSHLVGYFRETTVHGFRYVVDGKTITERFIWVAVILLAFACAAYLTHTSFREADENPISTSTEVLTVDKIPFPAVTVLAGGGHERVPTFRPVMVMLDALMFDCSGSIGDIYGCNPTEKVRRDFSPLIRNTVEAVYKILIREMSQDSPAQWVRSQPNQDETYSKLLLEAFCKVDSEVFDNSDVLNETLILLEKNFLVERQSYRNNTLEYLKKLRQKQKTEDQCRFDTLGSRKIKAMMGTMVILDVKTRERMPDEYGVSNTLGKNVLLCCIHLFEKPITVKFATFCLFQNWV